LATIKNIITTVFNSQGVGGVNRDINTLARNQTRLGQSSASAGRAFSAQASGLGGLVAAYAGAAATTFALQQAFDKLAKSAQAIQTLQGLTTLAAESAIGGQTLLKSIQDITKGQLTLFEAASQTNLALSAGFDTRQIEGLANVAIKASRALGRDLTDAMTRVVRGSAKMETELLDELGIYTKIEPATRAYAAAIGKSVTELTEYERRQAFVNGVIDEGTRKFNAINTTVPTAAESIEAFGAKMVELSTIFLGFLAEGVAPVAEFLTNNFAASLGAVGLILSLVASKGVTLLKAGFESLALSATAAGRAMENKIRILLGVADAAAKATTSVAALNVANLRGSQIDKDRVTALQQEAKNRALTRGEIKENVRIITQSRAQLIAERDAARGVTQAWSQAKLAERTARALPAGAFGSPQYVQRTQSILAALREQNRLQPQLAAARASLVQLGPAIIEQTRALNGLAGAATGARVALAGLASAAAAAAATAISRFGALAGAIIGFASKILFAVTIVQLFGSAIANFLGVGEEFESFFKNLGKTISSALGITKAREIKRTLTGIVGGSLTELEKTNSELANLDKFTFSQRKIFGVKIEVEKSKDEIVKEVTSVLQSASAPVEKTSADIAKGAVEGALTGAAIGFVTGGLKGALVLGIGGGIVGGIVSAFKDDEVTAATKTFGSAIRAEYSSAFSARNLGEEQQTAAVRAISVLRERYGSAASVDPQAKAFLKVNEQLVIESSKYVKNIEQISTIIAATGQTADTVSRNFNFDKAVSQVKDIKIATTQIAGIDIQVAIQTDSAKESFQVFALELRNQIQTTNKLLQDWGFSDTTISNLTDAVSKFGFSKITEELEKSATQFFNLNNISDDTVKALQALIGNEERLKGFPITLSSIIDSYVKLTGAIDTANFSLLRSGEVLRSVEQGMSSNNLSLEQFEQKMGAAKFAASEAVQSIVLATSELVNIEAALIRARAEGEDVTKAEKQRDALAAQLTILKAQLPNYRQAYELLKDQEDVLKSQIRLNEFIKEQSPKALNPLNVAIQAYTKDTEFAQAKTLEFIQAITTSTAYVGKLYSANVEEANKLQLNELQRGQILRATEGTFKNLEESLRKQGFEAELIGGSFLAITQTLEDGSKVTAIIEALTASQVINGEQNVELIKLQAKLGEQLIADSITLLSGQDAYLSKLRDTNALKERELELSMATAQEEGRKQRVSAQFEVAQFSIDSARQFVELEESRLEIAKTLADVSISAIERQISIQETATSREQAQLARKIEAEQRVLGILQAQSEARELLVSIATPLDKQGSNEAAVFSEQLNNRARILAQETALIELEAKSEQKRIDSERDIARIRVDQAREERNAAINQLISRRDIIEDELSILKLEQKLAQEKIQEQQSANLVASNLQKNENLLKFAQLQAEQDLEKKKATDSVNQLLKQLDVIERDNEVKQNFIDNYAKIVQAQKEINIEGITKLPSTTGGLREDLESFRAQVNTSYDSIFQKQNDLFNIEVKNNKLRLLSEKQLLDDKSVALEAYQDEVLRLAEQRKNAEVAALQETLFVAAQTYKARIEELDQANLAGIDSEQKFNDARKQLGQDFVNFLLVQFDRITMASKQLVQDFKQQVLDIKKSTDSLRQEALIIRVQAKFDSEQLTSQLQQQIVEADISRLQAEIRLTDARADIKEIPAIEAAKKVNDLQQKILDKQIEVEVIRFEREKTRIEFERNKTIEDFARVKAEIEAKRDLAIAESKARLDAIKAQAQSFTTFIQANTQLWNDITTRLSEIFQTGAQAIATAILSGGMSVSAVSAGGGISAPDVAPLTDSIAIAETAFDSLKTTITENAAAQVKVEQERSLATLQRLGAEEASNKANHDSFMVNKGIERQTEDALAKKRLQDAKDAGSKAAEEAKKAAEKITEAYKDITDKLKEATRAVTTEIIQFVGGIITSIAQNKVDQLQAQETQIQDALSFATEKLNDVRSRLEKSLDDETSQREKLIDLTEALVQSQTAYIDSLGNQEKKIAENSDLYIEKLLEQKRSILDLASTTRKSVALSKQDQILTKTTASLQESLDSTTESRIRAEEKLAQTQSILQGVTDMVNASSQGLSESLLNMRSAMLALQEVMGVAGAAGIDMNQIQKQAGLQKAFGDLSGAVNNFKEGVQSLTKVNGNYVSASGNIVANVDKFNTGMTTAVNALGGAQTGFGIGNAIASALGKSGFATQIGGAIGGALGSVLTAGLSGAGFLSGIATSISSAVGGAAIAGALFSFALPVIGALIGALFAKTPKSGATGAFDETGTFGIASSYESGGAKSAGLKDVITATYDSFFGSLEEFGIQLADEAKRFEFIITTRKRAMTAYYRDMERGIELTESVANAKEASEFFINSFLQTFRKGDLIVESIMPFADNLQAAIDNFATKAIDQRFYDSFKKAIDFAIQFDDSITSLRGSAVSTAEAIDIIRRAAAANAAQTAYYYSRFLSETENVFGRSSDQYETATAAVRKNALALIGLSEASANGSITLISLRDAIKEINAGAVLVSDSIEGIRAATEALKAANISEAEIAQAISMAIRVSIDNLVGDINDSLVKGLSLLENPAMEAVYTIEALTENSASRLSGIQGAYEQLLKEQGITAEQLSKQQNSIALSNAIASKELSNALLTLSEAELKAIISAEELIDAQTRQEASARLAAVQASNLARAQVKLAEINRRFISGITGVNSLQAFATSVPELLELFERAEADEFTVSLTSAINSIASGSRILRNFEQSTNLIASEFESGRITAAQYASALELVADTTLDTIETIEAAIDELEKITKDIVASYDSQKQAASSALEEIGSSLTSLLDTFGSKTIEVLRLYDTTLASVAKSGNELFNLRDTAQRAFETASKAVSEFEESNKLSGKTTSSLLSQITGIESQLASLAAKPFDFASFIEFSKLTSQQRALQVEYKNLTKVEQEYNKLLEDRTAAQQDLAFATATIDSLSDTLIDVRRQESEIIQKVEDAAKSYLKSQEDLENITNLLAEANFNLNQIRSNENDAVYLTIRALDELYASFDGLQDLASQIAEANIGGALAESIREATLAAYDVAFETANEADRRLMPLRDQYEQSILGYFNNLVEATGSIAATLNENPIGKLSDNLKKAVQEITISNLEISDQFQDFGTNLSQYIDLTSVSESYRVSLQAFADSLDITQYRFAILASSGGPLSNFNAYLVETYNAIGVLADRGAFLNLTFERIQTSFGNIFSIVGNDSEGLQSAFLGLNVVGQVARDELFLVNSQLQEFETQLGKVKVTLEGINASSVPTLIETFSIDVTPLNKISTLIQAVTVIDTSIGTLNLSTVESFASSLITFVEGINSSVTNLNISALSSVSAEIVNYIRSIGTTTDIAISLELRDQVALEVTNYVNAIGDSIPSLTVNTLLSDEARLTVNSYVYNVGSSAIELAVNSNLANSANQVINSYVQSVGGTTVTSTVNVNLRNSARSAINTYVQAVGDVTATFNVSSTLKDSAVSTIVSYVESIGSVNAKFNVDSALTDKAIEQLVLYVEALGNATAQFNISGGLANNAVQNIVQYVEALGNATAQFEISNKLANDAIQEIATYVVSVGNAVVDFNISTTLRDNALQTITTYVNSFGDTSATFTITGTTLSDNAVLAVTNYLAAIGNNTATFTITGTALSNNARLAVTNYLTAIGSNNTAFTITTTTLSSNARLAVTNYLNAIGSNTTALSISTTMLSSNAIAAVTTYLNSIGDSSNALAITFSATSGIGLKISDFVSALVTGSGITITYSATALNTLPNSLRLYLAQLTTGSGIDLSYNSSDTASVAGKVKTYIDGLKATIDTSMAGIRTAFDSSVPAVTNLKNALTGVFTEGTNILTTPGLLQSINNLTATGGVSTLNNRFNTLLTTIGNLSVSVTDNGVTPLQALRDKLAQLKSDITTQWGNVVLTAQSTTSTTPAFVRIVTAGGAADPNTGLLSTVATNTSKYPKIKGIEYDAIGTFATGGYVSGPGSATSDSIPARLSNGEYVLKASVVDKLGTGLLDALNSTGDINSALSASGRRGDSLVAHINPEEARALKRMGGSGTRNPSTGLLEFFNADGGVVGKLFAEQEASELMRVFGDISSLVSTKIMPVLTTQSMDTTATKTPGGISVGHDGVINYSYNTSPSTAATLEDVSTFTAKTLDLVSKVLSARETPVSSLINKTGNAGSMRSYPWLGPQGITVNANNSSTSKSEDLVRSSSTAYPYTQIGGLPNITWPYQGTRPMPNSYENRFSQTLDLLVKNVLGQTSSLPANGPINRDVIDKFLTSANEGDRGYFTDLYMLNGVTPSPISYNSSGGLVGRDSVQAMLEPGEFVLRKQAVDRMGIDSAIRLNSTGDVGGDIEVEVNVNNMGTAQTTVSTPEVRRENGKIIVDIILEDLRNNGPIQRQIRSIR
jgi:hypothetical protein